MDIRFVRYADDFAIYVKSTRAGERVMESVTGIRRRGIKINDKQKKSKVCGATTSTFLGFNIQNLKGKLDADQVVAAKKRFKDKIKKLTSRKKAGTFEEIVKKINQTTVGWINYYGIANMKTFIKEIQGWLNHRLRQLIWKRWKLPRTK